MGSPRHNQSYSSLFAFYCLCAVQFSDVLFIFFWGGVGVGRGGGDGKENRLNTYVVLILSFYI